MADSLQGGDALEPKEKDGLSELRDEISRLREEMGRIKDDAVREAVAKIRLQGGGIVQVSGGNGNWTITATGPTGGTVTGTFDCDSDPPVFNGQIAIS